MKIYSTIEQKPKICIQCGKPKKIFSHSRCIDCSRTHYSPIKKKREPLKFSQVHKSKPVIQNGGRLTQKQAFVVAYSKCGGRWFLTGEKVSIEVLTATNFAHVLPKAQNRYPWFKFYWKNIVLLTPEQHALFDNMTIDDLKQRRHDFPSEEWDKLFSYEESLKGEYELWVKDHPKQFKI